MKKIEILNRTFDRLIKTINTKSFERKDTSYRRSGGYFGTEHANLRDVIVLSSFQRTKHLKTYICLPLDCENLKIEHDSLQRKILEEYNRLNRLGQKKWAKESVKKYTDLVNKDIEDGTINTNYGKIFIQGNKHIYYAHPYYQHYDYNKHRAMPNTPKHWKVAQGLNKLIEQAKLKTSCK